jgi:hypothetical protein
MLTLKSTNRISKGGDTMKKALALAGLALFVLAIGAVADTAASQLIKQGNNLIGASLVPYDPAPSTVFKWDNLTSPITITGNRLMRWDGTATPPAFKYYSTGLGAAAFGKILLGTGYFLKNDSGADIYWAYEGVPNGVPDGSQKKTDMWISLPKAGYNMIANPFIDEIVWANCLMTDGNVTVTVTVAKAAPYSWWTGNLQYWDPGATPPSYKNVVLTGLGVKNLSAYKGYVLKTTVDNLALIVPAINL